METNLFEENIDNEEDEKPHTYCISTVPQRGDHSILLRQL